MSRETAKNWKESFTGFYKKHSRSLWFYIYKICGDESMADDIFQEAFYKYLKVGPAKLVKLNEFQQKAYVYKIAYRLFIDQKRRSKFEHEQVFENVKEEFETGKEREIYRLMDMEKSFLLMKPKERSLLWLAYVEGYSHTEIAGITGDKEKSIKVQLFRLKKKFAGILQENGYSGEN